MCTPITVPVVARVQGRNRGHQRTDPGDMARARHWTKVPAQVQGIERVDANDLDPTALEAMKRNLELTGEPAASRVHPMQVRNQRIWEGAWAGRTCIERACRQVQIEIGLARRGSVRRLPHAGCPRGGQPIQVRMPEYAVVHGQAVVEVGCAIQVA